MVNTELSIKIENLKKQYTLGAIGGHTLRADLSSWWAKHRGKEDPNSVIGVNTDKYGEKFYALNDISLEIRKGEAVGIIGSNGAGKSTLLKILSRVTAPTEGNIYINGRITSMLEVGTGFHPELTGRENIYMNGAILGMTKAEIDAKVDEIIDFSECRQFIDTPVKRYSSGMYVKLAFAVAAHLDSDIMIMDEVLAVGDVKFQKKCLGKMGDEANNAGKTILYVSHNMATIRQLCSRCIVLDHGKIIYDGDVETAIQVYAGRNDLSFPAKYDFSEVSRPSLDHGRDLRILSFEFLEKTSAEFFSGDSMRFKLSWVSKIKWENLQLFVTVLTLDEQKAGSAYSNFFSSKGNGEIEEAICTFDIGNLVEGSYQMILDIQELNSFGTHRSYDHPLKNVIFKIERNENQEGLMWDVKYYGLIRMNKIEVTVNA